MAEKSTSNRRVVVPASQARQDGPFEKVGEMPRSDFGSRAGAEFPSIVYTSIAAGFVWMLLAAWLAFGDRAGTGLDLAIATTLFAVFLLLPVFMDHTNAARRCVRHPELREFLASRFDTATGSLSPREAWLQVALIPFGLAIAATLIGVVYVWFS